VQRIERRNAAATLKAGGLKGEEGLHYRDRGPSVEISGKSNVWMFYTGRLVCPLSRSQSFGILISSGRGERLTFLQNKASLVKLGPIAAKYYVEYCLAFRSSKTILFLLHYRHAYVAFNSPIDSALLNNNG
jgi:hypothetical protein